MTSDAVDAFLRDARHLVTDDGLALGHATSKRHLYQRSAVQRRLRPVLTLLPSAVFQRLAHDRNLLILVSASPRDRTVTLGP
jgi:hypothetical protein